MVHKIKECRRCAKKVQCDLQKYKRLTKKFAVRLAVYKSHAINEFLAFVKPDPAPGMPTVILSPPLWEFTPNTQRDVDPTLLSPRSPHAPCPQISRFWSSLAPSFMAPPSRKKSLKLHSQPGSIITPIYSMSISLCVSLLLCLFVSMRLRLSVSVCFCPSLFCNARLASSCLYICSCLLAYSMVYLIIPVPT